MKLTDKKETATERVLVYGAPKSGKSLLVGKLSEHYNLIWFDNEQGWGVLRQLPQEWQARINVISIPDSKVFPIAAETWMKVIKGTKTPICQSHGKVSCAICQKNSAPFDIVELNNTPADTIVVFDSLTQLSQSFIAHITKNKDDDYKLEFDDWGNLKVLVEKFLSQVQVAGYNIVCITHEEEVEFEDKRKKIVPVCGSSKSSRNTAKYFDHVVYEEVKNKKHTAGSSTDYSMNVVTGSRTNISMEKATAPSLLDIFTSWKGGFSDGGIAVSSNNSTGDSSSDSSTVLVDGQSEVEVSVQVVDSRTPGQIALENLRKKQAAQ